MNKSDKEGVDESDYQDSMAMGLSSQVSPGQEESEEPNESMDIDDIREHVLEYYGVNADEEKNKKEKNVGLFQ